MQNRPGEFDLRSVKVQASLCGNHLHILYSCLVQVDKKFASKIILQVLVREGQTKDPTGIRMNA